MLNERGRTNINNCKSVDKRATATDPFINYPNAAVFTTLLLYYYQFRVHRHHRSWVGGDTSKRHTESVMCGHDNHLSGGWGHQKPPPPTQPYFTGGWIRELCTM